VETELWNGYTGTGTERSGNRQANILSPPRHFSTLPNGKRGAGGASLGKGVFGTARKPIHGGLREKLLFFTLPKTPFPSESPLSGRAVRE
jgi:hypothetical protein